MTRVDHVITGLATGGAERMLQKLVTELPTGEHRVISLTSLGSIGEELIARGIPVQALGLRPSATAPAALGQLVTWLRRSRPDVVQTWLAHADLVGGLAARVGARVPVVWGVRQSDLVARRATRAVMRVNAALSRRLPTRIVCNSHAGLRAHAARGYPVDTMRVIPNGFDLTAFRPDPAACTRVRSELGIPIAAPVVGLVARFDPNKGHATFAEAARAVAGAHPEVRFVLAGAGIDAANPVVAGIPNAHLLGRRDDVPALVSAFDVAVSASSSEGFSNTLGEAMAAGVPCVATDVGDSADIVGEAGRVVPADDPAALARGINSLLELSPDARSSLGARARARVFEHWSLPVVARCYEDLYEEVVADVRSRRGT
jgi:glycosyltransferase involved in cell wall biosynthesis